MLLAPQIITQTQLENYGTYKVGGGESLSGQVASSRKTRIPCARYSSCPEIEHIWKWSLDDTEPADH